MIFYILGFIGFVVLVIVIWAMSNSAKNSDNQAPPREMTDEDYMKAIMVQKHLDGDSNWTHPWEL